MLRKVAWAMLGRIQNDTLWSSELLTSAILKSGPPRVVYFLCVGWKLVRMVSWRLGQTQKERAVHNV